MKKKINLLKKLFLRVAQSSAINWFVLLLLIMGTVFNWYGLLVYKILCFIFILEILFLDANKINPMLIIRKTNTEEDHEKNSKI